MAFRETVLNDMPGHKMLYRFATDKKLDIWDTERAVVSAFRDWNSKHGFGAIRMGPGDTNVSNKLPVVDKLTNLITVRVFERGESIVLSIEIVGKIATKALMDEISTHLKNTILKSGGGKKRRMTRKRRTTRKRI